MKKKILFAYFFLVALPFSLFFFKDYGGFLVLMLYSSFIISDIRSSGDFFPYKKDLSLKSMLENKWLVFVLLFLFFAYP